MIFRYYSNKLSKLINPWKIKCLRIKIYNKIKINLQEKIKKVNIENLETQNNPTSIIRLISPQRIKKIKRVINQQYQTNYSMNSQIKLSQLNRKN